MNGEIYRSSKTDNWYTPEYAVQPILKYLKPCSTIWCPFDTRESAFVKVLEDNGHSVISTHIDIDNGDFFELNMDCDYIISNPPFSKRQQIIERLFEIGKPFAMLMNVVGLFDNQSRVDLFRQHRFELIYLNPRVAYIPDRAWGGKHPAGIPPFQSCYLCSGVCEDTINFETIYKKRKGEK